MNAPNEKDYLDAKLQAVIERVNGDARAHQVAIEARLDKFEQMVKSESQSTRDESEVKLAKLDASFQKAMREQIKWIVGAVFAATAVSISTISVLITYANPKTAAPVIVYVQPPGNQTIDKTNDIRK